MQSHQASRYMIQIDTVLMVVETDTEGEGGREGGRGEEVYTQNQANSVCVCAPTVAGGIHLSSSITNQATASQKLKIENTMHILNTCHGFSFH